MVNIIKEVEDGHRGVDAGFFEALHARAGADPHGAFLRPTPKVEAGIRTADRLHAGQVRKGRKIAVPYICHPLSVAEILARSTQDEDVIVAGLLHDTLEDCEYTADAMRQDFGARVTELVLGLTEDQSLKKVADKRGTWRERKQRYLDHLRIAPVETLLITCADKLHNIATMIEGYYELGPTEFPKRFNAPIESQLWYYDQFLEIMQERLGNHALVRELLATYEKLKATFAGA